VSGNVYRITFPRGDLKVSVGDLMWRRGWRLRPGWLFIRWAGVDDDGGHGDAGYGGAGRGGKADGAGVGGNGDP